MVDTSLQVNALRLLAVALGVIVLTVSPAHGVSILAATAGM